MKTITLCLAILLCISVPAYAEHGAEAGYEQPDFDRWIDPKPEYLTPMIVSGVADLATTAWGLGSGNGYEMNGLATLFGESTGSIILSGILLKGVAYGYVSTLGEYNQWVYSGVVSAGQYGVSVNNAMVALGIASPWHWIGFAVVGLYYAGCWFEVLPEQMCIVGYSQ